MLFFNLELEARLFSLFSFITEASVSAQTLLEREKKGKQEIEKHFLLKMKENVNLPGLKDRSITIPGLISTFSSFIFNKENGIFFKENANS